MCFDLHVLLVLLILLLIGKCDLTHLSLPSFPAQLSADRCFPFTQTLIMWKNLESQF